MILFEMFETSENGKNRKNNLTIIFMNKNFQRCFENISKFEYIQVFEQMNSFSNKKRIWQATGINIA